MDDRGYTLIEVLVALAILGLAIGGLLGSIQVLGRQQLRVSGVIVRDEALRSARVRIERVLQAGGAHRSADGSLSGDGSSFRVACGAPSDCRVSVASSPAGLALQVEDGRAPAMLPLYAQGEARFVYQGTHSESAAWPPAGPDRQSLRAVALVHASATGTDKALLEARIWSEQPPQCAFDVIIQDCR